MYLLDTNHCSLLLEGEPRASKRLRSTDSALIATCEVVRGELIYMAAYSREREFNLERVRLLLERWVVFPVDAAAATEYGALKAALMEKLGPKTRRGSVPIGRLGFSENDLWIAAVALARRLTVVSSDRDFARMKEAEPRLVSEAWA